MQYNRKCSKCNKVLFYNTKGTRDRAEKSNGRCCECAKKIIAELISKPQSKERAEQSRRNILKNSRNHLKKNNYEIWLEKYGKEEADKRQLKLREKRSENSRGENNSMYGRPSPKGSGNGWKGWYGEIFFRSLKELCFIILFLEKNGLKWQSGENKKFQIKYKDYAGQIRNYYPDFIVGLDIYECKPKRLWETPTIRAKTDAAKEFCIKKGMNYHLIDIPIDFNTVLEYYNFGKIKFLNEKYRLKFEKYCKERNESKSI